MKKQIYIAIDGKKYLPEELEFTPVQKNITSKDSMCSIISKIPGLMYCKNIIIEAKQNALLNYITLLPEKQWIHVSKTKDHEPNISRRTLHFGYLYNYSSKSATKTHEIPKQFVKLAKKIVDIYNAKTTDKKIGQSYFNQCIVNEYVGKYKHGIGWHIDSNIFGDVIGCFTLGHTFPIYFRFKEQILTTNPEKGSLYIMSGDSRYKYEHSIPSRLSDKVGDKNVERETRYSITFRHMKS